MTKEEIVNTLKEHYPRDVRKQLIKTILEQEKSMTQLDKADVYKTINQIFSFVLQQAGWEMGQNSQEWNSMPLEVMLESFPKIENTQWYKEQILTAKQRIDIQLED